MIRISISADLDAIANDISIWANLIPKINLLSHGFIKGRVSRYCQSELGYKLQDLK